MVHHTAPKYTNTDNHIYFIYILFVLGLYKIVFLLIKNGRDLKRDCV